MKTELTQKKRSESQKHNGERSVDLPIHKHPLYHSSRFINGRCSGCKQVSPIYGGYRCNDSDCNHIWYHKECGESLPEINHPSHLGQMEYWSKVREAGGFDLEGIFVPQGTTGLTPFDCERPELRYPHRVLMNRYARFGIHRYNMGHGTNLLLHHLKKFNKLMNCLATYYMTVAACDPPSSELVNVQVGIAEDCRDNFPLNISCFVARLQGSSEPFELSNCRMGNDARLPYWPSDFNDSQRFYEVSKSELQEEDWIRLYLELTLCTSDRGITDSELSQLEIVKVVIETTEGNEALKAIPANVYITFKGLALARVGELGEHVERRVVVRRFIDEPTGCLTLHGGYGFSNGEVAEERYISRQACAVNADAPPMSNSVFARMVMVPKKVSS